MSAEFITTQATLYDTAAATHPHLTEMGMEHMLFLANPKSRRAAGAIADLDILRRSEDVHGLSIEDHETSPDLQENIDLMLAHATPKSVIGVRAGDGGVNLVLRARKEADLTNPVQIIPGGNANDLAHTLYTWRTFSRPDKVATRGIVQNIYPLDITIQPDEGGSVDLSAFAYASFAGISALGAHSLNTPEYKNSHLHKFWGGTFLKEKLTVGKAFVESPAFNIETEDYNGSASDLIVATVPRMAKAFHPDVATFSPEARVQHVANKLRALGCSAAMLAHIPYGDMLSDNEKLIVQISGKTLYVQTDGEDHAFTDGMHITLGIGSPVPVVTTRKAA